MVPAPPLVPSEARRWDATLVSPALCRCGHDAPADPPPAVSLRVGNVRWRFMRVSAGGNMALAVPELGRILIGPDAQAYDIGCAVMEAMEW